MVETPCSCTKLNFSKQTEKKYDLRYIIRHIADLLLLQMCLIESTCDGLGV